MKPWHHHLWHSAVRLLCVFCFVALVVFVKVSYSARQEFVRGTEAHTRGEYSAAITHYERAIKWYTPFSRSVRLAVERLWTLGTEAEGRHDSALALEAYWALRGSLYAVQSVYLPYRDRLPRVEERLAALMAKTSQPEGQGPEALTSRTEKFARMLQRHTAPTLGGSLLVELGFLGWVGATLGLIWYAFARSGRWVRRPGLLWGSGVVIGFGVWIVGMLLA